MRTLRKTEEKKWKRGKTIRNSGSTRTERRAAKKGEQ